MIPQIGTCEVRIFIAYAANPFRQRQREASLSMRNPNYVFGSDSHPFGQAHKGDADCERRRTSVEDGGGQDLAAGYPDPTQLGIRQTAPGLVNSGTVLNNAGQ